MSDMVPLAALQREASMVNDLVGIKSFAVGVLHEILRAGTIEEARTFAELALVALFEHSVDMPCPGTLEDPADWRRR